MVTTDFESKTGDDFFWGCDGVDCEVPSPCNGLFSPANETKTKINDFLFIYQCYLIPTSSVSQTAFNAQNQISRLSCTRE